MGHAKLLWSNLSLFCLGLSLVSSQSSTSAVPGFLELQPSHAQRVEEQGRGFGVTCRFSSDIVGSNLRWTRGPDRKPITDTTRIIARPTRDQPTTIVLIFNNVSKEDEGLYTCLANIDQYGEAHKEFNLTIYMGISFEKVEFSQAADLGKSYTVTCDVLGDPQPSISWRRNGVAIDSTTGANGKYVIAPEGLTVQNVQKNDGGNYDCNALQMVQDVTSNHQSKAIKLVVNYPPELRDATASVNYAFLGGEVNLTCQAEGEPQPQYDWGYYENDKFVDMPLSEVKIREDYDHPSSSVLIKNMTERSHFREFVCRARNQLGSVERKYTVTEVDKPAPPIPRIHRVSANRVEFEVVSTSGESPLKIVGYRALVKQKGHSWENATIIDFNMGKFHIVDSLYHSTDYEVQFAARNNIGYGEFSDVQHVKTHPSSAASLTSIRSLALIWICAAIASRVF